MTSIQELCFSNITEVAPLLKSGEISPVELTESMLDRIHILDEQLHSFNTVTADQARDRARKAEKEITGGLYRGPLHGIPVALKDLLATRGIRTTCSSTILSDWIPGYNATVVDKLEDAGAISLGKLNMTEFALYGYHPDLKIPVNPWNAGNWAGVSSSGSGVATSAGLAFATLGTDTGGSIRYPSASNSIVGIKPTYGRVSRHGAFPLAQTLDHIGPMTRSVADAATVLNIIAGYDPKDPTSLADVPPDFTSNLENGVANIKIGIDEKYIHENSAPVVAASVMAAADQLKLLGAKLVNVDVSGILEINPFWGVMTGAEAAVDHAEYFPAKKDQYGPVFRHLLEAGHASSGVKIADYNILAKKIKAILQHKLADVDMLLCPSQPVLPPPLEEVPPQQPSSSEELGPLLCYSAPFNFSGNPTISLPCGFSDDNLPISLQLVGQLNGEASIIQTANTYEQANEWHKRRAPAAL